MGPCLNLCLGKSGAAGPTEDSEDSTSNLSTPSTTTTLHLFPPSPPPPPYHRLSISAVPESDTSRERGRDCLEHQEPRFKEQELGAPLSMSSAFNFPCQRAPLVSYKGPVVCEVLKVALQSQQVLLMWPGREIMKGLKGHAMGVMGGDRKHDHC